MTIGPEPMRRMRRRSVRLGRGLLLHQPVDDGDLGRRLLAAVQHVVEAARSGPDDLAVAPELLAEHAHALVDALADGVPFERGVALTGERRPLRLLAAPFRLPVRNQILGHRDSNLPCAWTARGDPPSV